MKIAIIGTGSLASLFSARLSLLSDVVMLGSWQEQIDTINQRGLTVQELDGTETTAHFTASDDPHAHPKADLALILTKSFQTETAIERTHSILAPYGAVITMQNGIGNLEQFQEAFGEDRATVATTTIGATMIAPGTVKHAGEGPILIAQPPNLIKRTGAAISYLRGAGFDVDVEDDTGSILWGKLCINVAINPLTALLGETNRFLVSNKEASRVMQAAAQEAEAVAEALDIELPYASAVEKAIEVATVTAANRSSMLQDRDKNRPTEIDAICGRLLQHAKRMGVPTPYIQWLNDAVLSEKQIDLTELPKFTA